MPRQVMHQPQTALFGIRSYVLIVKNAATPTLNPNTLPTVGMAAKLVPRPSHSLVVPKERTRLFRSRIQQQVGRASEIVTGTTRLHSRGLFGAGRKSQAALPNRPRHTKQVCRLGHVGGHAVEHNGAHRNPPPHNGEACGLRGLSGVKWDWHWKSRVRAWK